MWPPRSRTSTPPATPTTRGTPRTTSFVPGALELRDGAVKVPTGPGLGVELDHDALERLHRVYLDSGMKGRDDTGYMRRVHPEYELKLPRW